MCVILIKPKGVALPTRETLKLCFDRNPHGCGFMFADQDGRFVECHKGYMTFNSFYADFCKYGLTKDDSIVFHFRISTQAGVNPEMCHPFPWSSKLSDMKVLDYRCSLGIAHNGIIPLTSNHNKEYSDTALFIAEYVSEIVQTEEDLHDAAIQEELADLLQSKMVFLEPSGNFVTIGNFTEEDGILFSNMLWKPFAFTRSYVNSKFEKIAR